MIGSIIGSMIGLMVALIGGLLGIAVFAFWIWMLVHAITNKGVQDIEKIVWVLAIIFLPIVGSILYFFIARPKGRGALG